MPFAEIQPLKPPRTDDTGVRAALTPSRGMSLSIGTEAREKLGDDVERVKVFLDADPAAPRVRVVASETGPFRLAKPPLGDRFRILRIGHRPEFPCRDEKGLSGLACLWEATEPGAIEIDLPREFRQIATAVKTTINGRGDVKESKISLPAVGGAAGRVR